MSRFLRASIWALVASGLSVALSTACGSEDSARKGRASPGDAGSGGEGPAPGGGGTNEPGSEAGTGGVPSGVAGSPDPSGGGVPNSGGADGTAGASGEGNAAGSASCDTTAPSIEGVWTTDCNGYSCWMYFAASGEFANGCSNGQFESGSVDDQGILTTLGEGGTYQPYSTEGPLTRDDCNTLTRDYVGRTPPLTGPEMSYACVLTRAEDCAPSLLETLVGTWTTTCGSSTCSSAIDAQGVMTSTCSNGQTSIGQVEETGVFATTGSGGNYPDYSTAGVIALSSCDTFEMPYVFQIPPNTGAKTSAECSYTRVVD